MLNRRAICLGIFCVLFIPSAVLAQSQSAIYQSEEKVREYVDKKVEDIKKEISAVDTKVDNLTATVGNLSKDVAVNKTNITNMQKDIDDLKGTVDRIWYGILGVLGTLILSIAGYFLKSWREGQSKADNVDVVDRFAEQITKLTSAQAEAQAENSAQITRLISEISATRGVFGDPEAPSTEGLDEVTDDIRSQQRDAEETV